MSLYDMAYIASATKLPLDVHLMIEHPRNNIDLFLTRLRPGDTVYISHDPESEGLKLDVRKALAEANVVDALEAPASDEQSETEDNPD